MMMLRFPVWFLGLLVVAIPAGAVTDRSALWRERVATVVGIEFFVESELERSATEVAGVVVDDQGTVVFPGMVVNNRLALEQLKDFRIFLPGEPAGTSYAADYLGPDEVTGWHFLRVEASARAKLVPVTRFASPGESEPAIAEELWGIGLRKKDEDFRPFYLSSRVAIVSDLPERTAVLAQEVAGQGMPVFNGAGVFVGLTTGGYGQAFVQFSGRDRAGLPVVMINPDESSVVTLAAEVMRNFARVPGQSSGRPLAWLGANMLQPLEPEVARYLRLDSALVVGEVLEGSPAEKAGLRERDIILNVDGRAWPRFKPDQVLVTFFEREIDRRTPGTVVKLGVLRDERRMEINATLEDAPPLPREAFRRYFDHVGVTLRAFTYTDGALRRVRTEQHAGVIAHFVKPGSPAGLAGLRTDDWIKRMDGQMVSTYEGAVTLAAAAEADRTRTEWVILVDRGGETVELRIKLK